MIQIHKIDNVETVKTLVKKANLDYNDCHNAIGIFDGENILEFLIYNQQNDYVDIVYISNQSDDFQLILGVVKTLLFLADLSKVAFVTMPLDYKRQAIAIGFDKTDYNYVLKLEDYQNKCGC